MKYKLNKKWLTPIISVVAITLSVTLATGFVQKDFLSDEKHIEATLDRVEDNNIAVVEVCYKDNIQMVNVPLGEHIVDMTNVVSYEVTAEGLYLTMYDGTGYFLENK